MRGLAREEARQIAVVALFRALERFDAARGVPFAAYAAFWFRKESQRGRAASAYRSALPVHRLGALVGRERSADDGTIRELAQASTLEGEAGIGSMASAPEDVVLEAVAASEVRRHVAGLAPLSRRIVELRFGLDGGEPRSHRAVAALVGVSEFTVRSQLTRALRVLRARVTRRDASRSWVE
jgi:RNA polymerase sigma factor (sigma-70 family)